MLKQLRFRNSSRISDDLFLHNKLGAKQLDNLRAMELAEGCPPAGICSPLLYVPVAVTVVLLAMGRVGGCAQLGDFAEVVVGEFVGLRILSLDVISDPLLDAELRFELSLAPAAPSLLAPALLLLFLLLFARALAEAASTLAALVTFQLL